MKKYDNHKLVPIAVYDSLNFMMQTETERSCLRMSHGGLRIEKVHQ